MSDLIFNPFDKQQSFLKSKNRKKGAFCGKRAGKTEIGAIQGILYQEMKPNWKPNGIDPYTGVIIAPTTDMLRRLSMKKFLAYSKPYRIAYNKSTFEMTWHDGSQVIGLSADKPERIEGIKANWVWADEVFQMDKQVFLEINARVGDSKGYLFMTGSLGVQYVNPKNHWVYKTLKDTNHFNFDIHEWATGDNPHFPREELTLLENALDPKTFRAMFEIDWNIPPSNRVYEDFDDSNIADNLYNKDLPVFVAVDWGWNDPTVFLFVQYDVKTDTVFIIDEIVKTKTHLPKIMELVSQKPYKIADWYCDAAGLQTNEQTAKSNVDIMRDEFKINFKWRRTNIMPSIALVRSYIKTARGQKKLLVDSKCKSVIDEFTSYKFKEKNGIVFEEPVDKDNHTCDAVRYFFVNYMKDQKMGDTMIALDKWKLLGW